MKSNSLKKLSLQIDSDQRNNPMRTRTYEERNHATSNIEFIRKHAKPGSLILFGGSRTIESLLRRGQSYLSNGSKSLWSHICVYQGERADGKLWVLESDLDIRDGKLINGYTESTLDRFDNPKHYPNVAVLDFTFGPEQMQAMANAAFEIAQHRPKYPVLKVLTCMFVGRDLLFKSHDDRKSMSCSAFVRKLYLGLGIDLAPGVTLNSTFPEDIFRTPTLHRRFLLVREQRRKGPQGLYVNPNPARLSIVAQSLSDANAGCM